MKTLILGQWLISASLYLLILPGCQKEKKEETADTDTTAIFRISLPDDNCSDILISGTYYAGIAVSNPDSILVKVDVSRPGTWTISTDTINGISFSGGGIIKDTGSQFIAIAGAGVPVLPGNSVYTLKTGTSQLNYIFRVLEKDIVLEPVTSDTPYLKINFDDTDYFVLARGNDPANQPGAWGGIGDSLSFGCAVGPDMYPPPPGKGTISIQQNYIHANATEAEFKEFFKPGSYPFAEIFCDRMTDGIILFWSGQDTDINWGTHSGSDQGGSYFKIVGEQDGHNSNGQYYVKVKMKFSCKLYSYPAGQVKQISGEMVAYFIKYA